MYEELVKELRVAGDFVSLSGYQRELMRKAADAIEERDKAATEWEILAESWQKACKGLESRMPRWIPVTERLPEKRKYVLVRYKNNDMAVACWFDGDKDILFWRAMTDEGWCSDCDTDPTHWIPLPEPPKE